MGDFALRVGNLGKMYRIGTREPEPRTLWQVTKTAATSPFAYLKRMHRAPTPAETLWALRDVSFDVMPGEVLGIIGRNGAGKSTLLKLLARITEPTEGYVTVRGRLGSLLEVGTGFHPELTGRENIYMNGAILGMRRAEIESKFDEIVAFSEIERFLDTPVKRYSSGMYVRLAFAVAAHLEPEILIVDEVLAVGDLAFQKKCLGKMEDVSRAGRTVLFVSHNMAAVRKLCSRVVYLADGIKKMDGLTEPVIGVYLQTEAADILAEVHLPAGELGSPGEAKTLRFLTKEGVATAHFRLGEPWRIVLDFDIFKSLDHVIAGVGLANFEAVPITTYWSKPQDLIPGHYHVEFTCDISLAACSLRFYVGLSTHEQSFYYLQDAGHVVISEVAAGEQPVRSFGSGLLMSGQTAEICPATQ